MTRRIAYLLSQYPTYNHTFLLREVCALRALGVEVEVASLAEPDRAITSLPEIERSEAERAVYIKRKGVVAGAISYLRWSVRAPASVLRTTRRAIRLAGIAPRRFAAHIAYLGQACLVADWLRERRHDRMHCHFSSTVAMLAAELTGTPWSFTIHGQAEFDDVIGFGLTEKVVSASTIVSISGFARSQVLRCCDPLFWDRVVTVPLGIDTDDYTPPPARVVGARTEILTVGRLAPVKAQALLIDAVALLHAEGRAIRLRIVGGGPDRDMLERHVRARQLQQVVEFTGPQPAHEVTRLYGETDIFALPSFAEGVPVVLMEAMAMEIPCVASRLMGIPELIADGVEGILVRPADVIDTARGIRLLVDDPALRTSLGRAARARVARDYSLTPNVARLADVLFSR
jgi:glycosyltransferase involved in cell wall biosynthesis